MTLSKRSTSYSDFYQTCYFFWPNYPFCIIWCLLYEDGAQSSLCMNTIQLLTQLVQQIWAKNKLAILCCFFPQTLFRNKRFILDEIIYWNDSIFGIKKNQEEVIFILSFRVTLLFRHRRIWSALLNLFFINHRPLIS